MHKGPHPTSRFVSKPSSVVVVRARLQVRANFSNLGKLAQALAKPSLRHVLSSILDGRRLPERSDGRPGSAWFWWRVRKQGCTPRSKEPLTSVQTLVLGVGTYLSSVIHRDSQSFESSLLVSWRRLVFSIILIIDCTNNMPENRLECNLELELISKRRKTMSVRRDQSISLSPCCIHNTMYCNLCLLSLSLTLLFNTTYGDLCLIKGRISRKIRTPRGTRASRGIKM